FAGEADPVTIVDTCRHFDRQGFVVLHRTTAVTDMTGVLDGLAGTLTARAGLLHGKRALPHPDLSYAIAGCAVFRRAALAGSAPVSGTARDTGGDADLDAGATHGVFQ